MEVSKEQSELILRQKKWHKYGKLLIFACVFMYMAEIAAKGVFGAEIATIIVELNTDKVNASLANTYYFVTYGLVQILLCFFVSKLNMKKYLSFTLPVAAVLTILMGFATNITHMWILFAINGVFQAGLWSGINLILTRYLPRRLLSIANKIVNVSFAVGSIAAYGVSAVCVGAGNWRLAFYILGSIFLTAVIIFAVVVSRANNYTNIPDDANFNEGKKKVSVDEPFIILGTKKKVAYFYVISVLLSFIICALYYCLGNWLTSFLIDVYGVPQDISIYISIISPITVLFGPILTLNMCEKNPNVILQTIKCTLIMLPVPLLLVFFYDVNIVFALILLVIFIILAKGINSISLSVVTFNMRTQINAGTYSAMSNASASIAAGITPTIIGGIIDGSGWRAAFIAVFALVALLLIALIALNIIIKKSKTKVKES